MLLSISMSSSMEKSSWRELLSHKKLMYLGSAFNTTPDVIADKLDKLSEPAFAPDREYVGGTTTIKFKKPDGSTSSLLKAGIVYRYGKYFIVHNPKDGNNVIVYRYQ